MGVARIGPEVLRTADGRYRVRLSPAERDLLRTLPEQLRGLLQSEDRSVRRLFPSAHADDPELEADYRRLVHEDLLEGRMQALSVLESTADTELLDEEQMAAWLAAVNDFRLVLGTQLEVTEDMTERDLPRARRGRFAVYQYLGWLEERIVEAVSGSLDTKSD